MPVARACGVLQVSRSGDCEWLHGELSGRSIDGVALAAELRRNLYLAGAWTRTPGAAE